MIDSLKAAELYLGLESGFYSVAEAVAWADRYLAQYDYDDDMANIALAGERSPKAVMSLLGHLAREEDRIPAMRAVLARMSLALEESDEVALQIVRYCHHFLKAEAYDLPEDMYFMTGIDDTFDLMLAGIVGTRAEVIAALKADLAVFREDHNQ